MQVCLQMQSTQRGKEYIANFDGSFVFRHPLYNSLELCAKVIGVMQDGSLTPYEVVNGSVQEKFFYDGTCKSDRLLSNEC